ncbi:ABC-three component system middle component 1 [Flavobacterium sp. GB2R13]|uniref:ABC-three component system middle component 1 n=1 Tax=Flavobacterium algoris TaxID=3398733 RepID=UPI003A8C6D1E
MENYLAYKENILKDLSETYKSLIFKFIIEKININISVLFAYGLSKDFEENDNWEKISEEVALKYQSKISDTVDKWNIYIIYLCQDIATKELKNKIENNRFSNRKIVEDNFQTELTDEKAYGLIVKHITNTDLIKVIADTNDSIQEDYSPINENLWKLIPKDEIINGDTSKQKDLIELLKQLENEN